MAKHTINVSQPHAKRRRQSIIPSDSTNPLGKDGLSECFKSVTTTMYVAIPPIYSQEALVGIQTQNLDPLIMRYFKPAGGVIVGYSDLKILGQDETGDGPKVAKIQSDSPFAFTWVSVSFLVWSPHVGDTLDGYVSASSTGHIALLIHDTFNATIKKDDIPSNWAFVHDEKDEENGVGGAWTNEGGERVEGKLRFTVKYFNTTGRTAHVVGSLLTPADLNRSLQHTKNKDDAEKDSSAVSGSEPQYAEDSE